MGQGLRYTMNNLGDIVVSSLGKLCSNVALSTKGVKLTYAIHELNGKKVKIHKKIGQRLSELRKSSPENEIFSDKELGELFTALESVEEKINVSIYEREERLYPKKPLDEQYAYER